MKSSDTQIDSKTNGKGRADLDSATADVADQLNTLKADFASLAAAVQNLTGTGAAVAKDEAAAKVHAASQAGELVAQRAVDNANAGVEAVARYAREKPMMALAAAAGAGLLIGMLTSPRK